MEKNMSIYGKIIAVLEPRNGVSQRTGKVWTSQEYVIEELNETYPMRACFEVFGDEKIEEFGINVGDVVTVAFNLSCNEYRGKWYNQIRAWSVRKDQNYRPQRTSQKPTYTQQPQYQQNTVAQPQPKYQTPTQSVPQQTSNYQKEEDSGLPF